MKSCFQCKQSKDLTLFYKNKSTKDGHSGICKECQLNNERINNQKAKEWVSSLKTSCCKCGESRSWVLDFHHKDPKLKTINVSVYSMSGTTGFETKKKKIEEELKTCCVLCSNCHRDFHHLERTQNIKIEDYLDS
jgi:hypothetical protein